MEIELKEFETVGLKGAVDYICKAILDYIRTEHVSEERVKVYIHPVFQGLLLDEIKEAYWRKEQVDKLTMLMGYEVRDGYEFPVVICCQDKLSSRIVKIICK